jgi:hypothetical protein
MCGTSCHNNTKFLNATAEVCVYLTHKKWNSYMHFGAWHHNLKLWGQNHDIYEYSHYTSATIYTLHRDKVFVALPVELNCHFYSQ